MWNQERAMAIIRPEVLEIRKAFVACGDIHFVSCGATTTRRVGRRESEQASHSFPFKQCTSCTDDRLAVADKAKIFREIASNSGEDRLLRVFMRVCISRTQPTDVDWGPDTRLPLVQCGSYEQFTLRGSVKCPVPVGWSGDIRNGS